MVRSQHLVQSLVEWPIVAMLVASSNRIAFDAKEGMVIRTFVQIAGRLSARAANLRRHSTTDVVRLFR